MSWSARLRCLRGIDTLTALALVAEIGDFDRFKTAQELLAFVGLVPSEHSSGERRRQGSITKVGNSHVRRLLVESAWHARRRPKVGYELAAAGAAKTPSSLSAPGERQLPTVTSHAVPTGECQSDPPSLLRTLRCSRPRGQPSTEPHPLTFCSMSELVSD